MSLSGASQRFAHSSACKLCDMSLMETFATRKAARTARTKRIARTVFGLLFLLGAAYCADGGGVAIGADDVTAYLGAGVGIIVGGLLLRDALEDPDEKD